MTKAIYYTESIYLIYKERRENTLSLIEFNIKSKEKKPITVQIEKTSPPVNSSLEGIEYFLYENEFPLYLYEFKEYRDWKLEQALKQE